VGKAEYLTESEILDLHQRVIGRFGGIAGA